MSRLKFPSQKPEDGLQRPKHVVWRLYYTRRSKKLLVCSNRIYSKIKYVVVFWRKLTPHYSHAIILFLKTFPFVSCTVSHNRREKCHILAPHPLDIFFWFPKWKMFRLWTSGFWQCVVLYMNANVSEEHTTTLWRVKTQVWHWSDRIQFLHWSDRNQVWHWSDRVQAINGSGS